MSDPFGDDDIDFDTDEIARKAYTSTIALLRESTPLRDNSLSDDVGNPVTEQLPASPPEGTTLAALMAVGASIDGQADDLNPQESTQCVHSDRAPPYRRL